MEKGTIIKDTSKGIADLIVEYTNIEDIIQPIEEALSEWNKD